jgi:hypothetical protein
MKLIILDVNVLGLIFSPGKVARFSDLQSSLLYASPYDIIAVRGGKLSEEYLKIGKITRLLNQLGRSGRLCSTPLDEVATELKFVVRTRKCLSNDHHIIALARASGARLLCTDDELLAGDFRNPALISKPRGKVYRNKSHNHLLR